MGQVTSLFVRKVLSAVDNRVDKHTLMHSVGIDPYSPVDPSYMISDTEYYGFLERLAAVESDPVTISLRAGAAMRCDDYGAFGLAFKSATNLLGSYQRSERYARVLTSVATYEVVYTDDGAFMHLHRDGERRLGMRLSNEATMASIATISREVSSKAFNPIALYLKHPAPETTSHHEEFFGCPVHFESDKDALLVASSSLQTPNKLGDESISTFFDSHLEAELSKFDDNSSLEQRVRIHISRCLSEGVPAISDVAGQMGLSGRTLQRRLSEQGHTFQTLVDESRRQLAKRLLKETDYSLAEVAFMTGYSEQSAFTRAFKRWAGQTPRSYRLNV